MDNTINIAIVDDHVLFRQGLLQLLAQYADINIVIEADNGVDYLDKMKTAVSAPTICLLDINMPLMNGHDTLKQIRATYPDIKVLILSMFDNDYSMARMLGQGVAGYLNKGIDIAEVYEALVMIDKRGYYNTDVLLESVMVPEAHLPGTLPYITDNELAFLKLCCSQMSFPEIARKLNISMPDVDGYKTTLYDKLQVKDRFGLIYKTLGYGLF